DDSQDPNNPLTWMFIEQVTTFNSEEILEEIEKIETEYFLCLAESILDGHIDVNLCHWLLEYHFTWACLTYLAVNRTTIPDPACKSFAAISTALTLFHRLTVASISIITYLRVCKQRICDTGIYDWKIFLPVITISSIVSVLALDSYGPVKYWCAAKTDTIITPIASICTTFIVLSICLFCYIQTIQAIRSIKKQHLAIIKRSVYNKPDNSTSVISEVEMKVSIKVSGYILVFILQWIPSVPYDIYSFLGRTHPWVYCMVLVSVCMGVGIAMEVVILHPQMKPHLGMRIVQKMVAMILL
ncbi:15511_t:CDS:2, partial [Cetraspora pellucida]